MTALRLARPLQRTKSWQSLLARSPRDKWSRSDGLAPPASWFLPFPRPALFPSHLYAHAAHRVHRHQYVRAMGLVCVADPADTLALVHQAMIHGPTKRRVIGDEPKLPGSQAPCVGCRHEPRCQAEKLGCEALVLHLRLGASLARLAYAPRFPTAEAFQRAHAKAKTVAPAPYRRPATDDEAGVD